MKQGVLGNLEQRFETFAEKIIRIAVMYTVLSTVCPCATKAQSPLRRYFSVAF